MDRDNDGRTHAQLDPHPEHPTAAPLRGLAERIRAAGRPELAFAEEVLGAACTLDEQALEALRNELKAADVGLTKWNKAVEKRAAVVRREAATRRREAERARHAAERARAAEDVRAHYAEDDDGNGTSFSMDPGRTLMVTTNKRGEPERTVLARFSAHIIADVCELDAPEAVPRRARVLSVMCEGDQAPHTVEVKASEWGRGEWLDTRIPARGRAPAERRLRAHLLDAIVACSNATELRRYAFTGWVREDGRWVYLHGGGAIGAEGDVPGVEVSLAPPVDRFRFPAMPEGEDRLHAAQALVDLLSIEPAGVVVPMAAFAFRSVMGAMRTTLIVTGRASLGKSLLAGLVSSMFGPSMFGPSMTDAPPCSWLQDSEKGLLRKVSTVGDALLPVEDLNLAGAKEGAALARFETVARAVFDGAGANKLHRDGSARNDPPPRCGILSTGEVSPRGNACVSRSIVLPLNERPTPHLGPPSNQHPNGNSLVQRASEGELARAMALFVQWYAPRYASNRARLDALGREAARAKDGVE